VQPSVHWYHAWHGAVDWAAMPCHQVTEKSTLELATGSAPIVKLDDKHYKLVDKMEALTLRPPSLVGAKALTVKGPVKFVPGTTIKGEVTITNSADVCIEGCGRCCSCCRVSCPVLWIALHLGFVTDENALAV
jgi:hypothetical protein